MTEKELYDLVVELESALERDIISITAVEIRVFFTDRPLDCERVLRFYYAIGGEKPDTPSTNTDFDK